MSESNQAGDQGNKPGATTPSGGAALDFPFNENIMVRGGERLPQFDKGTVLAYAAYGNAKVAVPIYALVCDDALTPRLLKAANYMSVLNPSLVRLIAHGAMPWPPERKRKYVFIYENKLGQSIMPNDREGGLDWKSDKVMELVVRPIISVLMDLRDKDLIHGGIHPANLFDGGVKSPDRVILGECLSLPAGYHLPVLYQTIERGMTDPAARGMGMISDDLYALGATLAVILRSIDPMRGYTDAQIIAEKMENGSYAALTGKDRFTGAILELLRGLLVDDPAVRWSLDDVKSWLDGRRQTPKQSTRKLKANRPIIFNGHKYLRPEPLARDLAANPAEAVQLIDGGEMDQWLLRAVDDEFLTARIEKSVSLSSENGRGPGYPERLVTRLSIALDPAAPIRYKGLSVMPEGIGKALTAAYIRKTDIHLYQEALEQYLVLQWVDMYEQGGIDAAALISKFDACRLFLRQKHLGYGIERCIYLLNPEIYCLGDKIGFYQARSPEDIMFALEALSASPARPALLLDRHVIAFLSVKDRQNIDPYIADLSATEIYHRVMGEVKTLATIQKRSRLQSFPGITKWLMGNLDPVYERIHDRELRKKLKSQIAALAETGDIVKMREKLDNAEMMLSDKRAFRQNMRYYYDLSVEQKSLESKLAKGDIYGRDLGRQVSAVVAFVIAGIVIMVSAYLTLMGSGMTGLTGGAG